MVIADINEEGAKAAAEGLPARASASAPTSRTPTTSRRWSTRRSTGSASVDVLVNNAAIVPFIAWDDVDLDHWRRDHVGQPRRPVHGDQGCREADARGGLRAHREHRLQLDPRRHAEHGGLCGRQGRRFRLHPGARHRARQARDHRQRRGARPDRDRGRQGEPAQRGVRLRREAAGDPGQGPAAADRARGRVPRLRGGGLGHRSLLVVDGGHTRH